MHVVFLRNSVVKIAKVQNVQNEIAVNLCVSFYCSDQGVYVFVRLCARMGLVSGRSVFSHLSHPLSVSL